MLEPQIKQQLQTYLQHLKSPVELAVFLDGSDKSKELDALVKEIAGMSSLVEVRHLADKGERVPSLLVRSKQKQTSIRFAGVPMGHEFTSLVLALLHSGDHPIKVEQEVIEQVRQLSGPYQFESYISLSCQNCPEVVQALNMMAAINPDISNVMIDGALFPQEVSERNIMAVPSVYLNGELFAQGRIALTEILNKLDSKAGVRQAQAINEKAPFDLLVVGAGPAGASAAIYGARKGIRTGIVADRFGGQVQDTMAIENFISVKGTQGPKLVASLEEHVRDYDVDIMDNQKAKQVHLSEVPGGPVTIELENGAKLHSKALLLATGARWREMNVPGEQQYKGKGVAYCPHCDGPLFKGKAVAVIGGGNSGIEAAIDLAGIVSQVTVLEFDSKLRADEVLQKKARSIGNIEIIVNAQTSEVTGDQQKVSGLTYICRSSGVEKQLSVAGIFVQIGLVPNSQFLPESLALNNRGEIITDSAGRTNIPGIYAAGDVTDSAYKQIIIAMGSGATAALGSFDYLMRAPLAEESAISEIKEGIVEEVSEENAA